MIKQVKKILVFDVDGTLLYRTMQKLHNIQYDFKVKGRFIYLRPNLHHLAFHFQKFNEKSISVLWTSMLKKNADEIHQKLGDLGLHFQKLYTQENCQKNLSKDLRVIATDLKVDVDKIYLIDDSPHKRIENQNFIEIKQYVGADMNDQDIIRVIKQIYKTLEIPFEQKYIEEAQAYNIQYQMKRLTLNEKSNTNQKKEKFIQKKEYADKNNEKLQRQEKKGYETKGNNVKKYKQKKQIVQEKKIEQKEEQKVIKFNNQTKVIVFDLNKTLIAKRKQLDIQISHLKNNQMIQGNIIYDRPNIHLLQKFREVHPEKEIKYLVWTTMKGKKVKENCKDVVKNLNAKFQDVINGVQSENGPGKDLSQISTRYGFPLQNMVLVDDSYYKSVGGQNYINVLPYTGQKQDIEMIRIVGKLDKFIKCENPNCEIKKLVKDNQKQLYSTQKLFKQAEEKRKQQEDQYKLNKDVKIISNIKQKKSINCVVFDINQTLLVRTMNTIKDVQYDGKNKHYYIYVRPHLQNLCNFLQSKDNIQVCLWSTIKSYNCTAFQQVLKQRGLNYCKLFSQEDLIEDKKDLKIVSQLLKVPLEKIVLVDDNPRKSIEGQNYIQIGSFDGLDQQDDCLLALIQQLNQICEQKQVNVHKVD